MSVDRGTGVPGVGSPRNDDTVEGLVVVVTGGGSGLGEATCRRLAAEGARVVVNDRDEAAAGRVATDIGAETAVFDVVESSDFDAAIDRIVARHGRIDGLVNNAGIAPPRHPERDELNITNQMKRMEGRFDEIEPLDATIGIDDAEWSRMIAVHLTGTFNGTRAALRHMTPRRSGSIVNLSSILGLRPAAGAPHYSAAKAGIIALTKSVAQEVAPLGIRVNAICPGWIDTPLLAPFDEMTRAAIRMQIPAGRYGRPDEIGSLVRFLLSPASSYCMGDVFAASGGWV